MDASVAVIVAPSAPPGADPPTDRPTVLAYELFMLLLSLLSIVNTAVVAGAVLFGSTGPAAEVILVIDGLITPIFVVDFVYRLRRAPSRYAYLVRDFGWADLIASVPMLRIFRLFRAGRVVQAIRQEGSARLLAQLRASRALATFLFTVFLVIAVVELASATIYYAEKGALGSNIESAGDAIWWALVTITTVGYGDRYPVTPAGRAIGGFLLFAGIALFSVLTGFIANVFLAPRARPRAGRAGSDVHSALAAARSLLAEQEQGTEALRQRLDELERLLGDADDPRRGPP